MLKQITSIALCTLTRLALGVPLAQPAVASPANAPFSVNSTLDEVDDNPGNGTCHTVNNHCTLRAAVMEADFSSGTGATIILPSGIYSLTIPPGGADDASTGDLNLSTPPALTNPVINLEGAGAGNTIIDANQHDRVLNIAANRTATVSGLTLRGGTVTNTLGAGLYNAGTLTVTRSAIRGNQTIGKSSGGGAMNTGSLTLIQSTVSANSAGASGGGLYNNGTLLADRSTIDDNHTSLGGGIVNGSTASLILVNSTLGQNYSIGDGGGVYNDGQVNIYNTTIAGNWADSEQLSGGLGGGVYNSNQGTFNLRNSLIAGNNLGNAPIWDDCHGTLTAYGTDRVGLIGQPDTCAINLGIDTNLAKLNSLSLLGGLQDNGGPTWTIALLAVSNAISDGGVSTVICIDQNAQLLATDQRGAARVVGGICDIGAFEFLPPALYLPFVSKPGFFSLGRR